MRTTIEVAAMSLCGAAACWFLSGVFWAGVANLASGFICLGLLAWERAEARKAKQAAKQLKR